MTLPRRLMLATAAVLLVPGATAVAQAPVPALQVTLSPNQAGKGARLKLDLDGSQLGTVAGQTPKGVRLAVQPGFKFDAKAVAERCRAGAATCPAGSKIAAGTAVANVSIFGDTTATITAYLADKAQGGDLAGIVVKAEAPGVAQRLTSTGRVVRGADGGLELRFDDVLGGAAIPALVQVTLRRLQLTAGASRTVTTTKRKTKKVKVRGRTVKRKVKVRVRTKHHLLTNPKTCAGAWTGTATVAISDGSERPFAISAPCAP